MYIKKGAAEFTIYKDNGSYQHIKILFFHCLETNEIWFHLPSIFEAIQVNYNNNGQVRYFLSTIKTWENLCQHLEANLIGIEIPWITPYNVEDMFVNDIGIHTVLNRFQDKKTTRAFLCWVVDFIHGLRCCRDKILLDAAFEGFDPHGFIKKTGLLQNIAHLKSKINKYQRDISKLKCAMYEMKKSYLTLKMESAVDLARLKLECEDLQKRIDSSTI